MAVALTSEQSERLERILRGISDSSWSPQAIQQMRDRLTYDATHPLNPDAVQQVLERIWAKIDDATLRDTHTMDELLGYDESGLPT